MFSDLGQERMRFRKKTKEKKGKKQQQRINLFAAKSGLVGVKGYLERDNHVKKFCCAYNHVKYFCCAYAVFK